MTVNACRSSPYTRDAEVVSDSVSADSTSSLRSANLGLWVRPGLPTMVTLIGGDGSF